MTAFSLFIGNSIGNSEFKKSFIYAALRAFSEYHLFLLRKFVASLCFSGKPFIYAASSLSRLLPMFQFLLKFRFLLATNSINLLNFPSQILDLEVGVG